MGIIALITCLHYTIQKDGILSSLLDKWEWLVGGVYAMMTSLDKRSRTLDFASLKYGASE